MKKQTKYTLEKFQVAKLKNMKKIIGGHGTLPNTTGVGDDDTIIPTTGGTSQDRQDSHGVCFV
jgi:hypothetical protein